MNEQMSASPEQAVSLQAQANMKLAEAMNLATGAYAANLENSYLEAAKDGNEAEHLLHANPVDGAFDSLSPIRDAITINDEHIAANEQRLQSGLLRTEEVAEIRAQIDGFKSIKENLSNDLQLQVDAFRDILSFEAEDYAKDYASNQFDVDAATYLSLPGQEEAKPKAAPVAEAPAPAPASPTTTQPKEPEAPAKPQVGGEIGVSRRARRMRDAGEPSVTDGLMTEFDERVQTQAADQTEAPVAPEPLVIRTVEDISPAFAMAMPAAPQTEQAPLPGPGAELAIAQQSVAEAAARVDRIQATIDATRNPAPELLSQLDEAKRTWAASIELATAHAQNVQNLVSENPTEVEIPEAPEELSFEDSEIAEPHKRSMRRWVSHKWLAAKAAVGRTGEAATVREYLADWAISTKAGKEAIEYFDQTEKKRRHRIAVPLIGLTAIAGSGYNRFRDSSL